MTKLLFETVPQTLYADREQCFPNQILGTLVLRKDYLRKKICDNKLGLRNNLRAPSSPLEIQNLQPMIES